MGRFFESIATVDSERFYSAVLAWALSPDCTALSDGQKCDIVGRFLPGSAQGRVSGLSESVAESRLVDLRILATVDGKPLNLIVENKLKATYRANQLQDIVEKENVDGRETHLCILTLFRDDTHRREIPDAQATNVTYSHLYGVFPELTAGNSTDDDRARQVAILQEFREALGRIAALHDLMGDSIPEHRLRPLLELIPGSIGRSKVDRDQLWRKVEGSLNEDHESAELLVRWGFDKPFIRAHFQTIADYLNALEGSETWMVGETRGKPLIQKGLQNAERWKSDPVGLLWGIQVQFPDTCKLVLAIRDGYPQSQKEQILHRVSWLQSLDRDLLTTEGDSLPKKWKLNRPKTHAYCSLSFSMNDLVESTGQWWIGSAVAVGERLINAADHLRGMVAAVEKIPENQAQH